VEKNPTDLIRFFSPIGKITIAATHKGISHVFLGVNEVTSRPDLNQTKLLAQAKDQLLEYLDGSRRDFSLPLDWNGIHGFQKDVLSITMEIPFGSVMTYGQIAKVLGKPNASRAVGGALSRNPLPILIPCHRVIAASGA
jgi:methylated-DNA-[protein]-cysteine S-methyltransferase